MAEIVNPIINRAISEQVRPMAERARGLFILAQASAADINTLTAMLAAADDADILQDNRANEGISPLTVGQFRAATGLLIDLLAQINQDVRLSAVLGACVRPPQVQ